MGKGRVLMQWSGDLSHDKYGVGGHKNKEWMSTREARRKQKQYIERLMKKASKKHERNSTNP